MRENTWSDHLTAFLLSSRSTKVYRRILWQLAQERNADLKTQTFNQTLYRLRRKGILRRQGENLFVNRKLLFRKFRYSVIKNVLPSKTEKIIVSFDIPESKRKTRDWLRNQIKFWNFKMIQKSLWIGKGPLPGEFKNRLKGLNIEKNVKIFRVRSTNNEISRS